MKRLLVIAVFCTALFKAQVGIGLTNPDPSTNLHISPTDNNGDFKGTLFGRMSTSDRNTITLPAMGLIIFNTTENCLQVNNGTPAAPDWNCLQSNSDSTFVNSSAALFCPIYPGMRPTHTGTNPPLYSPSESYLYSTLTTNGSFAANDLFRIDFVSRTADTYSAILYNISGSQISFSSNINSYNNPAYNNNTTLNNNEGTFMDGDTLTYYREAQTMYVNILSGPNAGRKFIVGINMFKSGTTVMALGGNSSDKNTQCALTFIYEY
ncbi:hypothetical protein [Chryseobacterium contaminans]|nr:hypothetical protein [Chryseobacterium contaminans]SHK83636.1 hypothetical protein SAMN05444407_101315 [Chryseobacterium contaminans]